MKDMVAITIARFLVNKVICHFGVPDSIHTDQGRNFESTGAFTTCICMFSFSLNFAVC